MFLESICEILSYDIVPIIQKSKILARIFFPSWSSSPANSMDFEESDDCEELDECDDQCDDRPNSDDDETSESSSEEGSDDEVPDIWKRSRYRDLLLHWTTISKEVLSEEPFVNFLNYYRSLRKRPSYCRVMYAWNHMSLKQRLPFIAESFIVKVSKGKIDIMDEFQIHSFFTKFGK